MAALWYVFTFFSEQDWVNKLEDDGTRPSCWAADVQQEAVICLQGLQNMHSYYTARLAQSPESSVPWGEASFHFRMAVMLEWCRRVSAGRMPHGALLAHTRLAGHRLKQYLGYTVPATGVDWQQHGRDGVAAVRAILLTWGFYPQMAECVEGRALRAVASLADRNRAMKESGFPAVEWQKLTIVWGVELWVDDATMLTDYT